MGTSKCCGVLDNYSAAYVGSANENTGFIGEPIGLFEYIDSTIVYVRVALVKSE